MLAVALTLIFNLTVPVVHAQQNTNSGSGLQISPTRTDLSGQAGEQKAFSLILKNITQNELTAKVFLNDFESDNTSGTPQIIVDSNKRTPYTLANMLKNFKDVDLKAGETKEIKLTINIPGNVAPGAYFGALRYAAIPKGRTPTEAERQVALTASVAHLIFVEVPGDINEQIQIESLKAVHNNRPGTFFLKAPNKVTVSVKNLGNGFSRPFGKSTVTGWFNKTIHTYDVNSTNPRGIILPNSSRNFTNELKGVKLPGKYNLTASVAYGNGGEVITYKSSFIYMPFWAILLLIVLIGVVIAVCYFIYRKKFAKNNRRR